MLQRHWPLLQTAVGAGQEPSCTSNRAAMTFYSLASKTSKYYSDNKMFVFSCNLYTSLIPTHSGVLALIFLVCEQRVVLSK